MVRPIIPLILLGMLAACKKERVPATTPPPAMPQQSGLPAEAQQSARAAIAEEARDRALMVLPAPPGFKPESVEPKLKVTLEPESGRIKVHSHLRLKLTLQNIGSKTFSYSAKDSPLKAAKAYDSNWAFYFILAGGQRKRIPPPMGEDEDGGEFLPPEEAARRASQAATFSFLAAELAPGESLVSTPRTGTEPEGWMPGPADRLVEVADRFTVTKAGRVRVVAEHRTARFDHAQAHSLPEETFASEPISIEVIP